MIINGINVFSKSKSSNSVEKQKNNVALKNKSLASDRLVFSSNKSLPKSNLITDAMKKFLGNKKIKSIREYYSNSISLVQFEHKLKDNKVVETIEYTKAGDIKKSTKQAVMVSNRKNLKKEGLPIIDRKGKVVGKRKEDKEGKLSALVYFHKGTESPSVVFEKDSSGKFKRACYKLNGEKI